jgi:hypothetical protein
VNGRHLDKISRRLERVSQWMHDESDAGFLRAVRVPRTSGKLREQRAADLRLIIDSHMPELVRTVREHNRRGQQGTCRYCGQRLRLIQGPRAGLYALYVTAPGPGRLPVLCQDPNCDQSPDGLHQAEET